MRELDFNVKKVCADLRDSQPIEIRFLLDEFNELDLSPQDWKEVYTALLKRLTELHDPWQVLAVIYRAIEVRSNFIIAHRVVGKFLSNFYLIFEKLPGHPAYFIPSQHGRRLFESLVNPLERAEVQGEAERQVAVVRQLALTNFISGKGVRV